MRTAWTLLGGSIKGQGINLPVVLHGKRKSSRKMHYSTLTIYGCDGLEQGELMVRKYIDNMISQFHGIVLMQIGFILAFFAASRYCKQFTHRLCPVLQWCRLLTALQNDDLRRAVQLSLTGCCNLAEMADNFRKKAMPRAACWIILVG